MAFQLDPGLRVYATNRQWEMLEAWEKYGSQKEAAKHLNIANQGVSESWLAVQKKAGQHGYAPDHDLTHPTAPGMSSKGTSVLYNADGTVQKTWSKTKQEGRSPDEVVRLPDPKIIVKLSTLYDQEGNITQQWVAEKPEAVAQAEAWQEYAKALSEDLPRAEPVEPPTDTDSDLLAGYPVGDHHMGQLSWGEETGDSWDLKIGERMLAGATNFLVSQAPAAGQALIAFLGDFMHYDSFESVTPTSRNQLDVDSRFPKMVRASIRAIRHMIESTLRKHAQVHVIVEVGNHDLSSSIFLMECLANTYESEPRVTVDTSPMHFHYYCFGDNLIGTHHGHGTHMKNLPLIMAADRPKEWGAAKHRFWWTGHLHTAKRQVAVDLQDLSGCTVEQFRVLAATDAWAAQRGYRATRSMSSIILHRRYGEVARNTVNPEMFETTEKEYNG